MEAQLLQWKQVTSFQRDEPSHKEPLKPAWLAVVQLGLNGGTALAVEASHLCASMMSQATKNLWDQAGWQ